MKRLLSSKKWRAPVAAMLWIFVGEGIGYLIDGTHGMSIGAFIMVSMILCFDIGYGIGFDHGLRESIKINNQNWIPPYLNPKGRYDVESDPPRITWL